ncbi:MAG: hypothetical protein Q9191_004613, partial [Dirinaria sp. TL-2023a]
TRLLALRDPSHQVLPVGLDHFGRAVVREMLDEDEHASAQRPCAPFPPLEFRVRALVRPAQHFVVVFPAVDQQAFEMAQGEQVAEEDLVPQYGLDADYEREGERNQEFEFERFEPRHLAVFFSRLLRGGRGLVMVHAFVRRVLVDPPDVDYAH